MNGFKVSVAIAVGILALASCAEKKKSNDIIAPKPVAQAPAPPVKMQNYNHSENVKWIGKTYKIAVSRAVDDSSPVFSDKTGSKYHENKITLNVVRQDGSEFFKREFTKQSFDQCVDQSYLAKSTILGIVFDHVDGDNLVFVASVGSPDQLSDDFIPVTLTLSRTGSLSMKKGQDIGTSDNPNADEDEGV